MRKEYDFSTMTGKKNPHVGRLKKQVTIGGMDLRSPKG